MPVETIHRQFADLASYSETDKTAISVRDGVLEYLGAELGLEPADKVFTVYRSPATIANAAYKIPGIPVTDEHIGIDGPAPDTGSKVTESEVIDAIDEHTSSRLAVRNKLSMNDAALALIKDKRQLSLGYEADLVPHSRWDFEQLNIVPHHLAAVPAGRCGPLCSFLDRKPPTQPQSLEDTMKKLPKAFYDAEGAVSLEQIVEMTTALPEAIRKVPVEELPKVVPALMEVMSYAKEQGAMPESEEVTDEDKETEDVPEDETMADEDKPKFSDAQFKDKVKEAVDKEKAKFADAEVKRYAEVVTKARNFLDSEYDFTGKTANQVMRDALAVYSTDKFEDSELSVAFKLLRKPDTDYSKFGDAKPEGSLTARLKSQLDSKEA